MTHTVSIPADVPRIMHQEFSTNYSVLTQNTGRLLLFVGDQKIEHLNENFYGPSICPDANKPSHLFEIAQHGRIGAFAAHLGLIARFGHQYPHVNYVIKLNGKTNIIPKEAKDPSSHMLWSVDDVIHFKKNSGLQIRGVGYTVYLGSEYESQMLHEAAQIVYQAHTQGLVTILWMYPRGKHVADERDGKLIAGAAGIAAALGADFAKINPPRAHTVQQEAELLRVAVEAAGNTKLICSGGSRVPEKEFLERSYYQLHEGGIAGNAIGRNIYQHSLTEAITFTQALSALIFDGKSVTEACTAYTRKEDS
jgi:fructose-bisphosphate aldolase/6-deoxy-5-ketofructose 1-phosphate synthase